MNADTLTATDTQLERRVQWAELYRTARKEGRLTEPGTFRCRCDGLACAYGILPTRVGISWEAMEYVGMPRERIIGQVSMCHEDKGHAATQLLLDEIAAEAQQELDARKAARSTTTTTEARA